MKTLNILEILHMMILYRNEFSEELGSGVGVRTDVGVKSRLLAGSKVSRRMLYIILK